MLLVLPICASGLARLAEAAPASRPIATTRPMSWLYPIWANDKAGFIDRAGRVVVEPTYDYAVGPSGEPEGLAVGVLFRRGTTEWEEMHVIDLRGQVVARGARVEVVGPEQFVVRDRAGGEPRFIGQGWPARFEAPKGRYESCRPPYAEGLLAVKVDGKWGFIDRAGKSAIEPAYEDVRPFSEGLAAARQGERWGFLNHAGEWEIVPQYQAADQFREGRVRVELLIGGRGVHIDHGGLVVSRAGTEAYIGFSEGLAVARLTDSGRYGFVGRSGEFEIRPTLRWASNFFDGLAAAELEGGDAGYIDRSGRLVIKLEGWTIRTRFDHGLAFVQTKEHEGYIDTRGEWVYKLPARR